MTTGEFIRKQLPVSVGVFVVMSGIFWWLGVGFFGAVLIALITVALHLAVLTRAFAKGKVELDKSE